MSGRIYVRYDEGELVEYKLGRSANETVRVWVAMMLSPAIEACAALLRGESVPVDRIDPEWMAKLGRRGR
jgi:hypothetical protein